jgi:hypothetical protein
MITTNKQLLIQSWGFYPVEHGTGLFERNIYNDQGYTEYWESHKPDTIQFYKDGQLNHDYKIDWKLFQKGE